MSHDPFRQFWTCLHLWAMGSGSLVRLFWRCRAYHAGIARVRRSIFSFGVRPTMCHLDRGGNFLVPGGRFMRVNNGITLFLTSMGTSAASGPPSSPAGMSIVALNIKKTRTCGSLRLHLLCVTQNHPSITSSCYLARTCRLFSQITAKTYPFFTFL